MSFQSRETSLNQWKPSLCIACTNLNGCQFNPTAHDMQSAIIHCQAFGSKVNTDIDVIDFHREYCKRNTVPQYVPFRSNGDMMWMVNRFCPNCYGNGKTEDAEWCECIRGISSNWGICK